MLQKIEGLIAAPFTAINVDGSVNLKVIQQQATHLIATGVRGAFVCGTTGEGASLTVAERQSVAARWMEVAGRELKIFVHTGHNCIEDSKTLAAHAHKIGAHAAATIAPSFFKPACVADLVELCVAIAAAAPDVPFYYYHIPPMTGVTLPMAQFVPLAMDRIPNFAGIKFTHENLMDYSQALAIGSDRLNVLFGRDEILLSALAVGARGAVGSTYNYSAPIYTRIIEAFNRGDLTEARKQQAVAVKYIDLLVKYGGLPAGKAIMKMIGIDCGPVRLPLKSLTPDQYAKLRSELDQAGFFEAI